MIASDENNKDFYFCSVIHQWNTQKNRLLGFYVESLPILTIGRVGLLVVET